MQVRAVDFILVSVSDVERSRAFYRDTLGLTPGAEWAPFWYEFDAGGTTIAIAKPPPEAPQPPFNGAGPSFALAVPDVPAALAEVRAKGVPVLQEGQESSVCHTALIADPDGNLIWLHQRKDGTAG
jgi:catechol 2,3-dioxygenase-like lactoylglutathione lyase family enzyme